MVDDALIGVWYVCFLFPSREVAIEAPDFNLTMIYRPILKLLRTTTTIHHN